MIHTFSQDRPILECKYHKETYNPYSHWLSAGWEYDPAAGDSDEEIRAFLRGLFENSRGQSHALIKARAVAHVLSRTRIQINPHDWFPGISCWHKDIRYEILNKWSDEVFANLPEETNAFIQKYCENGAIAMWADFDHSVPDWDALLKLGFPGIRERAQNIRRAHEAQAPLTPEQIAYYDSIDLTYSAILSFLERLSDLCKVQGGEKAPLIRSALDDLRQGPPSNTYEVLLLIYLYFIISEYIGCLQVRSIGGNLDVVLLPYFRHDVKSGIFSKEDIAEFLRYFFMQISAIGNYWNHPFYLGGTDSEGKSLINEVSFLILEIYDNLNIFNPKIQIKVSTNMPRPFLRKALDMVRRKNSSIVFVGEPYIMRALMGLGYTENEARTADIKGCYECAAKAAEVSTAPLYLNLLKPVELALNNGKDMRTGETLGPKTGTDFPTFDDFYNAYLRQLEFVLNASIKVADQFEPYLNAINPTPIFSATIQSSLECMEDAYSTGSKYNNTAVVTSSLASAVDSLMAVRHFVYETGEVTLEEFRHILAYDWKGAEHFRLKVRKYSCKYGNNRETADRYAAAIIAFTGNLINRRPNARGGFWKSDLHSARMFLNFAPLTAATPDGRKRGDELSKNLSPSIGMDKNGATALIQSVLKLDVSLHSEGGCLDVMLHPSAVSGEDGLDALETLLLTYIRAYGNAMQFNIFDASVLRDAQKNPERYQNLQVRVCGWNAYFVDLPKQEQDAYIQRAENIAE